MASFVWVLSDGADLQPDTSHDARLATEDSEPERRSERITVSRIDKASVGDVAEGSQLRKASTPTCSLSRARRLACSVGAGTRPVVEAGTLRRPSKA